MHKFYCLCNCTTTSQQHLAGHSHSSLLERGARGCTGQRFRTRESSKKFGPRMTVNPLDCKWN